MNLRKIIRKELYDGFEKIMEESFFQKSLKENENFSEEYIRKVIREFFTYFLEESKKIDNRNNFYIFRRPFGLNYIDDEDETEEISEEELTQLTEAALVGSVFRKVPTLFDHLKWKLNVEQKQFLYDFINTGEVNLKESDWEYASKITGIPKNSIKSIRNTLSETDKITNKLKNGETVLKGDGLPKDSKYNINNAGIPATEYDLPTHYRYDVVNFKTISKEEADNLRYPKKSLRQKEYENDLKILVRGDYKKVHAVAHDKNLDEWARYYIVGKLKPKETRLNERTIEVDFEPTENYHEFGKAMLASNKKSPYWFEVEKIVKEFNDVFGMNYEIKEQYDLTNSKSKCVRIVLKNESYEGVQIWNDETKAYVAYDDATDKMKSDYHNKRNLPMREIEIIDHNKLLDDFKNLSSLNILDNDTSWLTASL